MDSKLLFVLGFLCMAALAMARTDEFNDYEERQIEETGGQFNDETKTAEKEEKSNDESKMVMEDMKTETSTALEQSDEHDAKNKGLCHVGIAYWIKPGAGFRCNCMKCTCKPGGLLGCAYEFAFCPYYYCGNQIYNPNTQICCCGKVHAKKSRYSCCGYFYFDTRSSRCCNYYSVKPRKARCPRFQI